jgi:hypothetical protein
LGALGLTNFKGVNEEKIADQEIPLGTSLASLSVGPAVPFI